MAKENAKKSKDLEEMEVVVETPAVEHMEAEIVSDEESTPASETGIQIRPLSAESIVHYSEDEQNEIMEIANSIDVLETDKIIEFGKDPIRAMADVGLDFIKTMKGTDEDKEWIEQVTALSNQLSSTINDLSQIRIESKKKGPFAKLVEAFKSGKDDDQGVIKKVRSGAELIDKLQELMIEQIERVAAREEDASALVEGYVSNMAALQKYIVTGRVAEKRIALEVEDAKANGTDMFEDAIALQKQDTGLGLFKEVLGVLADTRATTSVAILQNYAQGAALGRMRFYQKNSFDSLRLIFTQQSSTALLNNAISNAVESSRSIIGLNEKLIEENSKNLASNMLSVVKLTTQGLVNPEITIKAGETVLNAMEQFTKEYRAYLDKCDENAMRMEEKVTRPILDKLAATNMPGGKSDVFDRLKSNPSTAKQTGSIKLKF